jgi:hypothetical protein
MRRAVLGAGVGLLAAIAFYLVLSFLARPPELEQRLGKLAAEAETIEKLERRAKGAALAPQGAVCEEPATAASGAFQRRLEDVARSAGVRLADFSSTPSSVDEASGLQPVRVRFTATGPYDAVVGLLRRLADLRPALFVDDLHLRSKTTFAALEFSGSLLCSTVRR